MAMKSSRRWFHFFSTVLFWFALALGLLISFARLIWEKDASHQFIAQLVLPKQHEFIELPVRKEKWSWIKFMTDKVEEKFGKNVHFDLNDPDTTLSKDRYFGSFNENQHLIFWSDKGAVIYVTLQQDWAYVCHGYVDKKNGFVSTTVFPTGSGIYEVLPDTESGTFVARHERQSRDSFLSGLICPGIFVFSAALILRYVFFGDYLTKLRRHEAAEKLRQEQMAKSAATK